MSWPVEKESIFQTNEFSEKAKNFKLVFFSRYNSMMTIITKLTKTNFLTHLLLNKITFCMIYFCGIEKKITLNYYG